MMKTIKTIDNTSIDIFDQKRMFGTKVNEGTSAIHKTELKDYRPLLIENIEDEPGKPFRVRTILQTAGIRNLNGRIYSKEILERETKKFYESKVSQRRALGELDHPESSIVALKNSSHLVVEMKWEGDNLYGIIEILNTPSGSTETTNIGWSSTWNFRSWTGNG